jgi:replicative DNA helicase
MEIKQINGLVKDAFVELKKFQSGEKQLVKTGYECIDSHIGGLLNGDILLISALSGHGKSEMLFRMKKNILDLNVNSEAEDYVFLDISLEMKVFNIVLRGIHREMNKSKKKILFEEFTEEEKEIAKKCYESMKDERQFISQSPTSPDQFYKGCKEFLDGMVDKKAVFVAIDHVLLISGGDKKKALEDVVEYMNRLKLDYENVYFIMLSQMNRSIMGRISEKNNAAIPNPGDLYGSEFMTQITSYSIALFNPYKVGIDEYIKVNTSRYEYLAEHFVSEKGSKASFDTIGKLFYHVLKVREGEAVFKDLFIEEMDLDSDTLNKLRQEKIENKKDNDVAEDEDMDIPVFSSTALTNAKGVEFN